MEALKHLVDFQKISRQWGQNHASNVVHKVRARWSYLGPS